MFYLPLQTLHYEFPGFICEFSKKLREIINLIEISFLLTDLKFNNNLQGISCIFKNRL